MKSKIVIIMILLAGSFNAQNYHSIQLNGGMVMPRSSSKGFSAFVQYNYEFNNIFNIYIYTGYSKWDKFNRIFVEEQSAVQKKQFFNSYSSDNHLLIPLYAGTKINLHTNELFTSFVNFEIGYSYFSYSNYENNRNVDINTGAVVSYTVDPNSKTKINDNLFGIGIGAGIIHPFTDKTDIILSYKINSNFNSGEFGLFSALGTYSTLYLGMNLKL